MRHRFLILWTAAIATSAFGQQPAVGAVIGDAGRGGTRVNAFGGHVVWSTWEAKESRWYLTLRNKGINRRLPVPPRREPFDVDLGPGPRGGVAAVYSRCADDRGDGYLRVRCDLYRYVLGERSEVRLKQFSEPRGVSETMPTIWRRSIAFVRRLDRPRTLRQAYPRILRADGTRRLIELRGGTPGHFDRTAPGQYSGGLGPRGMDLRGSRLAFSWELLPTHCKFGPNTGSSPVYATEMWLATGRKQRLIGRGCAGDPTATFLGPGFDGDALYFIYGRDSDYITERRWRRLDLRTNSSVEALVFAEPVWSFAQLGRDTIYVDKRRIIRTQLQFEAGGELS